MCQGDGVIDTKGNNLYTVDFEININYLSFFKLIRLDTVFTEVFFELLNIYFPKVKNGSRQ